MSDRIIALLFIEITFIILSNNLRYAKRVKVRVCKNLNY